jgi:hypothetical protein
MLFFQQKKLKYHIYRLSPLKSNWQTHDGTHNLTGQYRMHSDMIYINQTIYIMERDNSASEVKLKRTQAL